MNEYHSIVMAKVRLSFFSKQPISLLVFQLKAIENFRCLLNFKHTDLIPYDIFLTKFIGPTIIKLYTIPTDAFP